MKKILACVLALSLMLLCVVAAAETTDVTGSWYLNVVETEGMQMEPGMLGMEVTMILNADGTVVLYSAFGEEGEEETGTWTQEGDIVTLKQEEAEDTVFALTEGQLVADMDGEKMIFGREKTEVEKYEAAPVDTDAALADFDGDWEISLIDFMGMQIPAEMAEGIVDMSQTNMSISNGVAVMSGTDAEGNPVSAEITGELADGVLTLKTVDEYENESVLPVALLEDGLLCLTEGDEESGMSIAIYYERVNG